MELVTNGMRLTMISRRPTPPIAGQRRGELTQAQLQWLAEKHPGIFRNRVERVEKRNG
jgi:hypothetical protein